MGLYTRLLTGLLILNAFVVINEERFLRPAGLTSAAEGSVSHKVVAGLRALRTVLTLPLIGANIVAIVFLLLLG
jgi:hypothetical protein